MRGTIRMLFLISERALTMKRAWFRIFFICGLLGLAAPLHHSTVQAQNRPPAVESVDWSPDGNYVAFAYHNGSVLVLDAASGEPFANFQLPTEGMLATSVAWNPDGSLLAISTYTGQIYLWDKATGQLRWFSDEDISLIGCVAWSPDGTRLASGNFNQNAFGVEPRFTMKVWDVTTGEALYTLPSPGVADLAWSPDGSRLALAEVEYLTILNTTTWEDELFMEPPHYGPGTVDWSPDSTRLVSAAGGQEEVVVVWDINGAELIKLPLYVMDAQWSPDGTRIAILGKHDIQIIDSQTGHNILTLPLPPSQSASELAWSPDGDQLAYGDHSGNLYIVDVASPAEIPTPLNTN
jgi:WD40 repeat protein